MLRIVTLTSLYPNCEMPQFGVFVENRLRHLLSETNIKSRVLAPIPWFPYGRRVSSKYEKYSRVPKIGKRFDIEITYSRYLHMPKIGMNIQAISMAISVYLALRKMIKDGYDFDLIDAHYFYPDGVAAVLVAKLLNKPVVVTARGSDLNVYSKYILPRALIKWSSKNADALITVCQALKDVLVKMSVAEEKITVLRNGVDLEVFHPSKNRNFIREKLGLDGRVLLMVGRLIRLKGHHLAIRGLTSLENTRLLIIGEGEERAALELQAKNLGLGNRVQFLGTIAHKELQTYYSAADLLLSASSSEGWANVILESLACGTPVVATDVGGTGEIISSPEFGELIAERTPEAIVCGVRNLFDKYPDRQKTRKYAEKFSWLETSLGQKQLFLKIT